MASDCLVLSSDCPNGPKEILSEKNGILFKNNSESDFIKKFGVLNNLSEKEKRNKIQCQKKIKKITIFNHYNKFQQILNDE